MCPERPRLVRISLSRCVTSLALLRTESCARHVTYLRRTVTESAT